MADTTTSISFTWLPVNKTFVDKKKELQRIRKEKTNTLNEQIKAIDLKVKQDLLSIELGKRYEELRQQENVLRKELIQEFENFIEAEEL